MSKNRGVRPDRERPKNNIWAFVGGLSYWIPGVPRLDHSAAQKRRRLRKPALYRLSTLFRCMCLARRGLGQQAHIVGSHRADDRLLQDQQMRTRFTQLHRFSLFLKTGRSTCPSLQSSLIALVSDKKKPLPPLPGKGRSRLLLALRATASQVAEPGESFLVRLLSLETAQCLWVAPASWARRRCSSCSLWLRCVP